MFCFACCELLRIHNFSQRHIACNGHHFIVKMCPKILAPAERFQKVFLYFPFGFIRKGFHRFFTHDPKRLTYGCGFVIVNRAPNMRQQSCIKQCKTRLRRNLKAQKGFNVNQQSRCSELSAGIVPRFIVRITPYVTSKRCSVLSRRFQ